MLTAHGEILAKQGRRAEARARYEEALRLQDLPVVHRAAIEKALRKL
jgi:predicted negative regulator of RcsB-dependent stress response